MISPDVVGVVVAPALAAQTEVEGDVVTAPLEVVVAKGFVAALAISPSTIFIVSILRIQFKLNTALLSTVRASVRHRRDISHFSHI